jgi:hypothetical protein
MTGASENGRSAGRALVRISEEQVVDKPFKHTSAESTIRV